MSGLHRVRSLLVATVLVVSVLGAGAPVAAQVDSNGAEGDVFDANETESTIDAIMEMSMVCASMPRSGVIARLSEPGGSAGSGGVSGGLPVPCDFGCGPTHAAGCVSDAGGGWPVPSDLGRGRTATAGCMSDAGGGWPVPSDLGRGPTAAGCVSGAGGGWPVPSDLGSLTRWSVADGEGVIE